MTMAILEMVQRSFNWLTLIDLVGKTTLLLAGAGLLTALLRRSSAASRHLVWTCALMAALALPVLSLTLPRWNVPLVTLTAPQRALGPVAQPSADDASARMAETMQSRLESAPIAERTSPTRPVDARALALLKASWPSLIAVVWAAGALVILARLAIGIGVVQWMSRRTDIVSDAPWLPLAREIASQLGLTRVTFRRSHQPAMPMAWGVFRPSVLMPADADAWPQDRLRIVLLHELAHVRRADCLTHILAQTACALYWMNPLAWVAARRLRTERERACDDLVLACGTPGPDYADQLLEIARAMGSGRFSRTAAAASLAMAHRSQLEGRLMSILDPSVPRHSVNRVWAAAATTFALVTIVPLASVQPWVYAAPAMIPAAAEQTSKVVQKTETVAPVEQQGSVKRPLVQQEVIQGVTEGVMQGVAQGAMQGVAQGAIQGVTQGVTQGISQGVTQGVTQGVLQGVLESIPNAVSGAFGQKPNPQPSPKPGAGDARPGKADSYKADPKVVAALTEALKDSDKEVRESAMHALVQMRDPGIFDPLVVALKDASPDVREQAAFGLGQLRDKRAVGPLTGALKDSAANVREQVVFALGQLRDPAAVDGLAVALRDESADVREQAAFALGQIRDERAVQPLISVIKDPSAQVREQAVFALGQLRASAAFDALAAATKDSDAEVRAQAVFALGQTRDPRAVDALTAALKDSSAEVRQQAAFALGQIAR
jgi:HEAT repeat protein/beta-lactamase regulating signal transducer with metallopeptidase domain